MGIGFAVPIKHRQAAPAQLRQGEDIERAYLGVQMDAVNEEIQQELDLPWARCSDHRSVDGGPAADAGLAAAVWRRRARLRRTAT